MQVILSSNSASLTFGVLFVCISVLYESVVFSTLLYGADLWPVSVVKQMIKLEAPRHKLNKFQRRLLRITSKDKVRNDDITNKTVSHLPFRPSHSPPSYSAGSWVTRQTEQ